MVARPTQSSHVSLEHRLGPVLRDSNSLVAVRSCCTSGLQYKVNEVSHACSESLTTDLESLLKFASSLEVFVKFYELMVLEKPKLRCCGHWLRSFPHFLSSDPLVGAGAI